jgi:hypothetical protein
MQQARDRPLSRNGGPPSADSDHGSSPVRSPVRISVAADCG